MSIVGRIKQFLFGHEASLPTRRAMDEYKANLSLDKARAKMLNDFAAAELAAYDRMTERYKEEQKAEEDEFRRLHPEATDMQVIRHIIECGYGPRLYNPPLSARVKYIVVE